MNGNRLKELRKSKGLTQEELGKILGVNKASICCYEKETRNPNIETIIALMAIFNVTSDYLIGSDKIISISNNKDKKEVISVEEFNFIKELRKNKYLAEILLEDPKRSIELIDKKIG